MCSTCNEEFVISVKYYIAGGASQDYMGGNEGCQKQMSNDP